LLGFGTGLELGSELEVGFEFGSGSELEVGFEFGSGSGVPLTTGSALKVGSGIGLELSLGVGIGQTSESSASSPFSQDKKDFFCPEDDLHGSFLQNGFPFVEGLHDSPFAQQIVTALPKKNPVQSVSSFVESHFNFEHIPAFPP
jgi:hypothetical protein